ncbi:hypothetical protein BDK51DRAFT_43600 [Blyttiomyces helicus]|uniref:Secreted protein n=1 Tax=Blyttiomyces helicus TaxID=388810 RepID=A0A4P9WJB2_9FUNG|nr:hypothetical protein BDK51DRAFT_43600 [Blyttiomyces helicus]|eukprot:RKO93009.1 hypothetical protein BDK51DRAFT_43600 [Blyttiomyces helicus]
MTNLHAIGLALHMQTLLLCSQSSQRFLNLPTTIDAGVGFALPVLGGLGTPRGHPAGRKVCSFELFQSLRSLHLCASRAGQDFRLGDSQGIPRSPWFLSGCSLAASDMAVSVGP